MSTHKAEIVKINEVLVHPNADALEIVTLIGKDWQVVTRKGLYSPGNLVLYLPIDSILPKYMEETIFPPDSKIKLTNSRVKSIKLRGFLSQGMIVSPSLFALANTHEGYDATSVLGITKYEPPVKHANFTSKTAVGKKQVHPDFKKYTGIENAKNYTNIFTDGEMVSVTEKIHGSNFRCGWVPFYANTFIKKIKKFLGIAPKWEFVYGSHQVQLQNKLLYKGYYDTNIYSEAVTKYGLKGLLKPGEVLYGEIYGPSVQKGYAYGCTNQERKLIVFDTMVEGAYLDPIAFKKWAEARQLPIVPELYRGPYNKDKILELREGPSVLAPSQKIREGVVVKPLQEEHCYIGRKIVKYISDTYLLKNQDNETLPH